MAQVKVKLSQLAVDNLDAFGGMGQAPLDDLLTEVADINTSLTDAYSYASSWTTSANSLALRFTDGARLTFTGTVLPAFPGATFGTAVATSKVLTIPGAITETINGTLNYNYNVSGGFLSYDSTGSTVNSYRVQTLVPVDPTLGKVYFQLNGAIGVSGSGDLSGTLSTMTAGTDKFFTSAVIGGNFALSGNLNSGVSANGTLTSYRENYQDRSYIDIATSMLISGDEDLGLDLLEDETRWGGNDDFQIDLPLILHDDFVVRAGAGADQITAKGGGGRLYIYAGDGNDTITLLDASPHVDGGADIDTVRTALSVLDIGSFNNVENLVYTGRVNSILTGNGIANGITGGAKNDVIQGGGGDDSIDGGAGVDVSVYSGARANYTVNSSGGPVTVQDNVGGDGTDTLLGIEQLRFADGTTFIGTAAADRFTGAAGNSVFLGNGGNDSFTATGGDNLVVAGDGANKVTMGAGNDTIMTGNGSDKIVAGEGNNTVYAGGGADKVAAGAGNDRIAGGDGNDTLTGGAGADIFRFDTAPNATANLDRITDFLPGTDKIELENGIFTALATPGALAAGEFRGGAGIVSAADADDHLLYNSSTGALYYDADGTGLTVAVQIARLASGLALSAADFVVT